MSMIFLIGMPGVGKSYWAEKLALANNIPHIDLDMLIEQKEGQSISSLFNTQGEAYFREIETTILNEIIDNNNSNAIIACGGGTPCFADNLTQMKKAGKTIYLHADVDLLISRLQNEREKRPLLQVEDMSVHLQQLLNMRDHIYEQADYILDAKDISLSTFDKIISSCINRP
ncbi:MAG: shikimate kinase [Bacteroidetes bacterium]|nr:shikimate kinase [Bacteroidota bacterium]